MKKIVLGSTALRSAPIAFGCMRMAGLEVEKAERIVNLAVEQLSLIHIYRTLPLACWCSGWWHA